MVTKEGQYYYAPHRRRWGIWQYHGTPSSGYGTFIGSYPNKEAARKEVYRLNGWGEPKNKA